MTRLMKRLLSILLVLMMLGGICGCSSSGSGSSAGSQAGNSSGSAEDPFTVGFSIITLNIPYYGEMADTFKSECEARGWTPIIAEAGMDVETTLNDCTDMIQNGVDALVIASWYGDSLGDVLEKAEAANIPVYFINTGGLSDSDVYVGHVIADDVEVAKYSGTWTAQYFQKQGKNEISMVSTTSASTVGRNRVDGYITGLKEAGMTVNVLNEYICDSREDCMAALEDALTAYDHIDLVYGIGTNNNLGEYDAIDAAQREECVIVGWDLAEDDKALIDTKGQFIATLDVDATYEMTTTLDHVEAYAKGEKVERLTNYYPVLYTSEGEVTYEDVFGK